MLASTVMMYEALASKPNGLNLTFNFKSDQSYLVCSCKSKFDVHVNVSALQET